MTRIRGVGRRRWAGHVPKTSVSLKIANTVGPSLLSNLSLVQSQQTLQAVNTWGELNRKGRLIKLCLCRFSSGTVETLMCEFLWFSARCLNKGSKFGN